MAIQHKYIQTDWRNGFETHNAILDVTPYEPEVMFIGTYNPDTRGNEPEFFYGRNYFWTGFRNLFVHNTPLVPQRRDWLNPRNPSIEEIFALCSRLKLTFADLISQTLHNGQPQYEELPRNKVSLNGEIISLIADQGLAQLDELNQIQWNTDNIIEYLCLHPNIKSIYFTRQPRGIWEDKWNAIVSHKCMQGRSLTNIHTPSGRPLPTPIMGNLLNRWVHNVNPGFGRLNNDWLLANGVTLQNF